MKSPPHILLLLLLLFSPLTPASQTCSSSRDIMVTDTFLDFLGADSAATVLPFQPVLATSDGGAVYAATRGASIGTGPRILKVNSEAKFEWSTQQKAAEDSTAIYRYYSREIVEQVADSDSTLYYVYVAGYVTTVTDHNTPVWGFVMKYSRWDGTLLSSALMKKSDASCIYTLLLDSRGNLSFGGYSYVSATGTYSAWLARVTDKSTLSTSDLVLSSSIATPTRVFRAIEDTSASTYVLAGGLDTTSYLWVAGFTSTAWSLSWEYALPAVISPIVYNLMKTSSTYALLASQVFYTVTRSGGISSGITLSGSYSMTVSPTDPAMLMIVGYDGTPASFAYYYDPMMSSPYTAGLTAQHSGIEFHSASFNPSYPYVWISAYILDSNSVRKISILKLECVTPLPCTLPALNYRNQGCYTPSSTGCFSLCATCLLSGDINACDTVRSIALQSAASIFVARCPGAGPSYSASTSGCGATVQSSCHVLCGGDCIAVSDATKCAQHCKGAQLEPYIDDSELYLNTCKCKGSRTVSAVSSRCALTSDCHPLCANSECGETSDNTKCIGCLSSGAHIVSITIGAWTTCACAEGFALSGTECVSCHPLCRSCLTPGNSSQCVVCSTSITNVEKIGTAAPYTCSCVEPTVYDDTAGLCVYQANCSSHCNGTCLTKNNASSCIGCATGITPEETSGTGVICACPIGTVYVNQTCISVLSTNCSWMCGTGNCTVANDPLACVGSCSPSNLNVAIKSSTEDIVECGCANGTHLSSSGEECVLDVTCDLLCESCADSNTCLECPAGKGMVLANAKCICATSQGYLMVTDQPTGISSCLQASTGTANSIKYSGYDCGYSFAQRFIEEQSCRS